VRCPKCGEDNSEKFRFCGMCGTLLEPPSKVASSRPGPAPNISSAPAIPTPAVSKTAIPQTPIPQTAIPQTRTAVEREHEIAMRRPLVANTSSKPAALKPDRNSVPPISGPSMLGLDFPVVSRPEPSEAPLKQARLNELSANQLDENRLAQTPVRADRYSAKEAAAEFDAPRFNDLSVDSFRQTSFSGLDSYIEQEQAKSGVGRALLLLILLAALGAAGWWTYNNYRSIAQSRKAQSDAANAVEAPPESSQAKGSAVPITTPSPAVAPGAKQSAPASDVAEGPSENAGPAPGTTTAENPPAPQPTPAERPAPVAKTPIVAKTPPPKKIAPKREPVVAAARASRVPTPVPTDNGDSSFRKAEAYLYGHGAPQNCDEAVRNLKEASAKSNAKARSAFGTMYATGHCVPRDLPTSYLWFALALRVDPNNQILEKDLNAVWNQMTPPERQMATRMKQ
jgi:TPR repeat protein